MEFPIITMTPVLSNIPIITLTKCLHVDDANASWMQIMRN